ncbi:Uncharacterized nitrogen regulatory PII-like protein MJ0059 [Geodia barretti]|uniref:Uncharacterized nitrogen regulatory PII-like protein MJ0059 n=1 Tax=Geodia barretti TaxID=519541 RepID=A0AA35T7G8_GEOBA|nr:Uncharacterized nitrogen regulatory PII-like protein MJ0059 [Geodia barretti]
MNKIEAIFRPERLNNVKDALSEVGIVGLTVTQVTGRGAQGGVEVTAARGLGTFRIDMLPKVKLEVVVNDPDTDRAVDVIRTNAITGNPGDGKIFIYPVSDAIRIRTGGHVVGIARIVREGYPDTTAWDSNSRYYDPKSDPANPTWMMVDIKADRRLPRFISLNELKANPSLVDMMVTKRGQRLSVQPVKPEEWSEVIAMAERSED